MTFDDSSSHAVAAALLADDGPLAPLSTDRRAGERAPEGDAVVRCVDVANDTFAEIVDLISGVTFEISGLNGHTAILVVDQDSGEVVRRIQAGDFVDVYLKLEECRAALSPTNA
jgi:hypothetical protein